MSSQQNKPEFQIRVDQPNPSIDLRSHFQVSRRESKRQKNTTASEISNADTSATLQGRAIQHNIADHYSIVLPNSIYQPFTVSIAAAGESNVESKPKSVEEADSINTKINDQHSLNVKRPITSSAFIKRNKDHQSMGKTGLRDSEVTDQIAEPVLEVSPQRISESTEEAIVEGRPTNQNEEYSTTHSHLNADPNLVLNNKISTAKTPSIDAQSSGEQSLYIGAAKFKSLEAINPAWTVENYRWPSTVETLTQRFIDRFEVIGNFIVSAIKNHQSALAVTGLYRRQGQTTLAICLADWAAKNGLNCLLIDADMNQPGLALAAGLPRPLNWRKVIRQEEYIESALVRSISDQLDLMPQGESALNNSVAVDDWQILEQLICDFKPHYDLILVDFGPIREWIRTSVIRAIDGAISVNHAGIDEAALKGSIATLKNRGIPVVAVTENRSPF